MKKIFSNKIADLLAKTLIPTVLGTAILYLSFMYFAKPLFKKTIINKIYISSDSIYKLDFDKIQINIFSGSFLLTDFEISPDTTQFFKIDTLNENLYHVKLDTFEIKKINLRKLLFKQKMVNIKELSLINPEVKIFGLKKKDTSTIIVENSANFQILREDAVSSVFKIANSIAIGTIIIKDGNFDFLKPRTKNPSPFTINSITFILNDFFADKKTFSNKRTDIFSEDISLKIRGYGLNLNDNVHKLNAETVNISTKKQYIEINGVQLFPKEKSKKELAKQNINILNLNIDQIYLDNADFKKIFVNKIVDINSATIKNFSAKIYHNKKKNKNKFNKDSILRKIDLYPMFKNFLGYIKIDTLKIEDGKFKDFVNLNAEYPKIQIENYDITIFDFLIDSLSGHDTNRIAYAHNFLIDINGFKHNLNDSIHALKAEHFMINTQTKNMLATNLSIKSTYSELKTRKKINALNDIKIGNIDFIGIDMKKFINFNEIHINKVKLTNSNISIKRYNKKNKNKGQHKPINKLLLNFADKIKVENIKFLNGKISFISYSDSNKMSFAGNYRLKINNLSFDPYNSKITKITKVGTADILLTKGTYNTRDSIYSVSFDSVYYSTKKSQIILANLKLEPHANNLVKKLTKTNKNTTITATIPRFTILNTNLNNAFQADSLYLDSILLQKPVFEVVTYPAISNKKFKKKNINLIKRREIKKLVETAAKTQTIVYQNTENIDSISYQLLKQKRKALDNITKTTVSSILNLNILHKNFHEKDSTINIINQITAVALKNIRQIAVDTLTTDDITSIVSITQEKITALETDYNAPKFNKNEIFNLIGQFLPQISSNFLFVDQGLLFFKQKKQNEKKIILSTQFSVKLNKFKFDTTKIKTDSNLFFAKDFIFSVNNSVFNLNDSTHQLKINKIDITSHNSKIAIKQLSVVPKNIDTNKICSRISVNEINLDDVDFKKLYFYNQLKFEKFVVEKPEIKIYLPTKKEKKEKKEKKDTLKLFLPRQLKLVKAEKIIFNEGKLKIYNPNTQLLGKGNFSIIFDNFFIDSVTNITKNTYFLPIDNFNVNIFDFEMITPDSTKKIHLQKLNINSNNALITAKNFQLIPTNKKIDSTKNIIRANVKEIKISGIDIKKLRFNNELIVSNIHIDTPVVNVEKMKSNKKQKFEITDIDAYKMMKKFVYVIDVNIFGIRDLKLKINDKTKPNVPEKVFNNISVKISDLYIDSTVTSTSPELLYAKDINFTLKNIKKYIQDSIYSINIGKISGSTEANSLKMYNVSYQPIVDITKLQHIEKFKNGYRVSAISGIANNLIMNGLDYRTLLLRNSVNINSIIGDSVLIDVFLNKHYPHDDRTEKKHLIEHILDLKIPLNINIVNLKNFNLFYNEINKGKSGIAGISLKRGNLKILKLTNDTNKINSKDLYSIIMLDGFLNDTAQLQLKILYELKTRGNFSKIFGKVGSCKASLFNSYTVNGVNMMLEKGKINSIDFHFKTLDTLAIGKMKMKYKNMKAYVISKDTVKRKKLKFLSWIVNTFLVRNSNPKYGVYAKIGEIGYIHDRSYGDIKFWLKAILSGMQSTVAFNSKDVKRIKRINRKNKKYLKNKK